MVYAATCFGALLWSSESPFLFALHLILPYCPVKMDSQTITICLYFLTSILEYEAVVQNPRLAPD